MFKNPIVKVYLTDIERKIVVNLLEYRQMTLNTVEANKLQYIINRLKEAK